MSQEIILEFLRNHPNRTFTSKQIVFALKDKVNKPNVYLALRKLRKEIKPTKMTFKRKFKNSFKWVIEDNKKEHLIRRYYI